MSEERLIAVAIGWSLAWIICLFWQGFKNGTLLMLALIIPVIALYYEAPRWALYLIFSFDLIAVMWLMAWPKYPQHLTVTGFAVGAIAVLGWYVMTQIYGVDHGRVERAWMMAMALLTLGCVNLTLSLFLRPFVPMDPGFMGEIKAMYRQELKRREKHK